MSNNKKTVLASAVLVSSVLLSGCGLFGSETVKKIDPPKSTAYTKDSGLENSTKETATSEDKQGMVNTELYLIDKNGFVVSQTLSLPKTTSVAKQAVEHLVENGPVSEMLPNGFRAVLPADTEVSVDIKDGVATVDLSKEFKNYQPEDELKILQSLTWTLTQFDSVKTVKLKLNGNELNEMPVNGTPISDSLSRKTGINMDASDVTDIMNTRPVTVYYIGGEEGSYYYVPVTKRVSNSVASNIDAAVMELAKGPASASLESDFMGGVKLLDEPKIEGGKVTLNFNDAVYGSFEEKIISQHLVDALVLSLTEQEGIKEVSVLVNGKAELVKEDGKKLTEPVTRPEKVNTGSF